MTKVALLLGVLVRVVAPAAVALDRAQEHALLREAVRLSGLSARDVRIVVERPARFRQRIALLDRSDPRAAQDYDETAYQAFGLATGGKGVLRKTLIELQDVTGLYDPAARTAYVQAGPASGRVHSARWCTFDRSGRRSALVIGADLGPAEALARAISGRA